MTEITPETKPHKTIEPQPIEIGISRIASTKHPEGSEDSAFVLTDKQSPLNFFGVFDGMGGHFGGAEASSLAQKTVINTIENSNIDPNLNPDQVESLIKNMLLESHIAVKNKATGILSQMGTTGSLSAIWEGKNGERKLIYGNVGDSRIYVRRNGEVIQLTKDDNLAHMGKPNTLTQAIGQDEIEPRMGVFDLKPGDSVITVSDGITDALESDLDSVFNEILSRNLTSEKSAELITKRAREFSLSGRKMDDQTVVVVQIENEISQKKRDFDNNKHLGLRETEEPYRLPNGTMVKVRRSDGSIDDDWFVIGQDAKTGRINLMKSDGKATKSATPEQLDSINPQIKNVTNWDDLNYAINQLGEIHGSQEMFTITQLINLITRFRRGEIDISRITRTHDLREKVRELMELDNTRNALDEI